MNSERSNSTALAPTVLAPTVVRVVSLWILTGAFFKLFWGTPNDLPLPVLQFLADVDPGLKLHVAIAIELVTVTLALLYPRYGWPLVAACFGVFVAILVKLLSLDAKSCGCFGTKITMPPWAMLSIDSVCLIALLAVQPWKRIAATKFRAELAVPLLAAVALVPWLVIDDGVPSTTRERALANSRNHPSSQPPVDSQNAAPSHESGSKPIGATPTDPQTSGANPSSANPVSSSHGDAQSSGSGFKLPDPLPRYVVLSPLQQKWVGRNLRDTELGKWLDVDNFPQDAEWILFRYTCDHCKAHFEKINAEFNANPKTYVLVHVPDDQDEKARVVGDLPPHFEILGELPKGTEWVGTTPWTLEVENGIVKRAYLAEGEEEDSAKGSQPGPKPALPPKKP